MADQLVVFNNIQDWFPPVVVQKDLITVPRISIDLRLPYPEGVLDKGQAFVTKVFNPKFDASFPTLSKKIFGQMQSLIDAFQKQFALAKADPNKANLTEAGIKKDLAALNTKLEFCVDQWKKAIEKLAAETFDEAVAKWDKEVKAKIKRAKAKVIIKAVVLAAITLTAAALAIAAAVVTGGAAAVLIPAVIGASVAALGTVIKLHREMTSGFQSRVKLCDDKIKEVKADLLSIEGAITTLAGASEKDKVSVAKRFKLGTSLLGKHLGQLEKFHRDLATECADLKKKIVAQQAVLEKTKEDPRSKNVRACIDVLENRLSALEKRLKDLTAVQKVAQDNVTLMDAAVAQGKLPKTDGLRKIVDAFSQTSDLLLSIVDSGGKLNKAAADYDKALKAKK